MKAMRYRRWIITALAAGLIPNLARTDTAYPSRPITLVVPVAAGGAPDVVSRIVADKLSSKLNVPVMVENRPGGGERIGAEFVARAAPDGYTLLAAPPGSLVLAPLLYANLSYDPAAFVPVTILTTGSLVLLARPGLPVSDVRELVALAKANPGKLTYASPGVGTPPHLSGEMLKAAAGIQTTHVPYKGLAPALADLMAGRIDIMFDNLGNSLAYIRDGRLRALAIAGAERVPELPEVPAIAETFPGVRASSWFGVMAPPKTPTPTVQRLAAAIGETLRQPEVAQKLRDLSLTPVGNSPSEAAAFVQDDFQRWHSVVNSSGLHPE